MTIGKRLKNALKGEFVHARQDVELAQGDSVKILRIKNGLSQNQLAKITGLSQSTISGIENNRIKLGIERAKTLARALNVHPAVLAFPDWENNLAG